MRRSVFIAFVAGIAAIGFLVLTWQHREIAKARLGVEAATRKIPQQPRSGVREVQPSPSLELLRLRNDVTMLNKELAETRKAAAPVLERPTMTDWEEIHSGPRVSEQPGFVSITNLSPAGHATPANAFQSLQFALRNQQTEELTPTKMKEIWDVPDDFDDPNARYSIGLGHGIGRETGYRIVREQVLSTEEVLLVVDFETKEGGSMRQERVVTYRNGKWRVKPDSVTRQR